MPLAKSDVKAGDEVYLTRDVYPEVATLGTPQQLVTIGIHKASEIPDQAFERGLVIPVPKNKAESEPEPKPETTTRKTATTAKTASTDSE